MGSSNFSSTLSTHKLGKWAKLRHCKDWIWFLLISRSDNLGDCILVRGRISDKKLSTRESLVNEGRLEWRKNYRLARLADLIFNWAKYGNFIVWMIDFGIFSPLWSWIERLERCHSFIQSTYFFITLFHAETVTALKLDELIELTASPMFIVRRPIWSWGTVSLNRMVSGPLSHRRSTRFIQRIVLDK